MRKSRGDPDHPTADLAAVTAHVLTAVPELGAPPPPVAGYIAAMRDLGPKLDDLPDLGGEGDAPTAETMKRALGTGGVLDGVDLTARPKDAPASETPKPKSAGVSAALASARDLLDRLAHRGAVDPDDIERDDHGRFAAHGGGGGDVAENMAEIKAEVPGQGGFDFGAQPEPTPEPEPEPVHVPDPADPANYTGNPEDWTTGPRPAEGTLAMTSGVKTPTERSRDGRSEFGREIRGAVAALGELHGLRADARPVSLKVAEGSFAGAYASRSYAATGEFVSHSIAINPFVELTLRGGGPFAAAHEIGHYVAQCSMEGPNLTDFRKDASEVYGGTPPTSAGGSRSYPDDAPQHWRDFFDAIDRTGAEQRRGDSTESVVANNRGYLRSNAEVWARAYSQWTATQDPTIGASFQAAQDSGHWIAQPDNGASWHDHEMSTEVGPAVEGVLRAEGLMI